MPSITRISRFPHLIFWSFKIFHGTSSSCPATEIRELGFVPTWFRLRRRKELRTAQLLSCRQCWQHFTPTRSITVSARMMWTCSREHVLSLTPMLFRPSFVTPSGIEMLAPPAKRGFKRTSMLDSCRSSRVVFSSCLMKFHEIFIFVFFPPNLKWLHFPKSKRFSTTAANKHVT